MPSWLVRRENAAGEWCVIDMIRDYRVCGYHHASHGGPHLHVPIDGRAGPLVPVARERDAAQLMRAYARAHDAFDEVAFEEMMKRCKSERPNG